MYQRMNAKIKVLILISISVAAVIAGSLIALQSTVKANTTNGVASDVASSPSATSNWPFFMNGYVGFGGTREMGRGFGRFGGPMMFGGNQSEVIGPRGFGAVQVSSAFTQNVTSILNSSSDVQSLISQGYNVTSIRPIITTSIDGNGNVVTQATNADVVLQGTSGRALVVVSLTEQKVTKIVTTTINNNPT